MQRVEKGLNGSHSAPLPPLSLYFRYFHTISFQQNSRLLRSRKHLQSDMNSTAREQIRILETNDEIVLVTRINGHQNETITIADDPHGRITYPKWLFPHLHRDWNPKLEFVASKKPCRNRCIICVQKCQVCGYDLLIEGQADPCSLIAADCTTCYDRESKGTIPAELWISYTQVKAFCNYCNPPRGLTRAVEATELLASMVENERILGGSSN